MRKQNLCRKLCLGVIVAVSMACANDKAHNNFLYTLKYLEGKNISAAKNLYTSDELKVRELPNGLTEYAFTMQYKFGDYGPCTKIFEVDSSSGKITKATFIGAKRDCISPL